MMPLVSIHIPKELHPATQRLVVGFAEAMAQKLLKAQKKYDYGASWQEDDWREKCAQDLLSHVRKGDPVDVANYCAFMWHHGWKTSLTYTIIIHPENTVR